MKIDSPKINNLTSNGFVKTKDSDGSLEVDTSSYQKELTCVSKTADYTANPNELVNCDVSAGSFKVTLPSAPVDGTIIYVKLNAVGTNKYLTIATSGTDKFNTPTGTVEIYMYLFGEYAQMQYCSDTGLWTTFISAGTYNFANQNPGVDASTPITNADISIDTSTRVLTITPPLGYFNIFSDGGGIITRFRKVGTINFPAFTNTSGMWYFYFDATGTAVTTQTPWTISQFPTIIPIYRVLWNATLYNFTITSGSVVEGATYTNNGQTFTIRQTYTGVTTIKTSGTGDPSASGTLTRATGTGDATLTFSAYSVAPRLVAQYIEYHLNDISADTHIWFHLQGAQWINGLTIATNALVTGTPNADGRNTVVALSSGSITDDNLEYTITNDSTPTEPWQQDLGDTTPATLNATNSALFTAFRQNGGGSVTFRDATRFPFDWQQTTNIPNYITATGVRTPVADKEFFVYFIYATQNPVAGEPVKVVSATATYTTIANARAFNWTDVQNTYPLLNDGEVRPLYRLIFEYRTSYNVGAKYSVLRETQDLRKAAVTSTTAATGSVPASSVTFVPYDGIGATNVQSAISEVADERLNLDQTVSQTITAGQPIQDTLTASELVATDASKKLSSLAVATYPSLTELSYVKGVTSAIQTQLGDKENISNKSTNVVTDGSSDTKYPSVKAIKDYADSLVTGLLDYRGAYDASGNTFPTTGGSGSAGAILKGDMWIISVVGTLGSQAVQIGDSLIANEDAPGQTASKWNILNGNISYTPEDAANKVTSISGASTDTQYPSAKLVYDQLAGKAPALGADENYVTDAQLIVIGNTSGTNSGDNAANSSSLPIAGGTLTGGLVLVAGTTTVQPIKMVAGTNLTTPVAGVFEFDGTSLFFSI